jgi:glycosyltransferase involved in cell wall biosynthesis
MITVSVTIPVFNEDAQLAASIAILHDFLQKREKFQFEIVIVDNGSTDQTWAIARYLCNKYTSVRSLHLKERGRGRALKAAWEQSYAEVLAYMDVDLSSDLDAFPTIVEAILAGGFDVATGSRLLNPSLTTRSPKREVISRAYNLLVKTMFQTKFSDAQCGFKAIAREAARSLLPLTQDPDWFLIPNYLC